MSKLKKFLTFRSEISEFKYLSVFSLFLFLMLYLIKSLENGGSDATFVIMSIIRFWPITLLIMYVYFLLLVSRLRHAGLTNPYILIAIVILSTLFYPLLVCVQFITLGLPKQFFHDPMFKYRD